MATVSFDIFGVTDIFVAPPNQKGWRELHFVDRDGDVTRLTAFNADKGQLLRVFTGKANTQALIDIAVDRNRKAKRELRKERGW